MSLILWIIKSFEDSTGQPDYVKLTTFVSFLVCLATWLGDLVWDATVQPFIFDAFMYIVIAGFFGTLIQYFPKKKQNNN